MNEAVRIEVVQIHRWGSLPPERGVQHFAGVGSRYYREVGRRILAYPGMGVSLSPRIAQL